MRSADTCNSFTEVIFSIFSAALTSLFWSEVMLQYYSPPVGGADAPTFVYTFGTIIL